MATQVETTIKTAGSKKSLQTARETWQFIKEDYMNGHKGKAQGKPIAWSCAGMDKEFSIQRFPLGAFGLQPVEECLDHPNQNRQ